MGVRLVVRSHWSSEPTPELVFEFDQERIAIGRSVGSDVCIPHPGVSSQHATVRAQGAGYVVQDEGSTNGTTVSGARLFPGRPKPLKEGDRIDLGGFGIEFRCGIAVAEATSTERTGALARRIVREVLAPGERIVDDPRLVVLNGPEEGQALRVPAPPTRLSIGRAEECDLPLSDGDASRVHAEITRDLDGVLLRDLESKNGVLVNERPVRSRRLRDRDEVRIGATVIVFEDPAEARVRELVSAEDVEIEPPLPPAPLQEVKDGAQAEGAAADAGAQVSSDEGELAASERPAPRAGRRRRRGVAGADVVIYLLAALVLALSVTGLVLLLQSG